jgi:hypothetical protein
MSSSPLRVTSPASSIVIDLTSSPPSQPSTISPGTKDWGLAMDLLDLDNVFKGIGDIVPSTPPNVLYSSGTGLTSFAESVAGKGRGKNGKGGRGASSHTAGGRGRGKQITASKDKPYDWPGVRPLGSSTAESRLILGPMLRALLPPSTPSSGAARRTAWNSVRRPNSPPTWPW